jgi:phage terminase small subunit
MAFTNRQEVWIEEYFRTWNATEAARRAGYAHPKSAGTENLANPAIAEEIKARIAEKTMGADEALVRLAEQARAEYSAYFKPNGTVDLKKLLADGKGHLIKKIKPGKFGDEIEFHDAQTALLNIGRHHKLFVDRTEMSGDLNFTESESASERIAGKLDSIVARIRAQGDSGGTSTNTEGSGSA